MRLEVERSARTHDMFFFRKLEHELLLEPRHFGPNLNSIIQCAPVHLHPHPATPALILLSLQPAGDDASMSWKERA